jgi:hypothetical protein
MNYAGITNCIVLQHKLCPFGMLLTAFMNLAEGQKANQVTGKN